MKVYFDNCSLQRPLDNRSQIRVDTEANAMVEILSLCETGEITLISSEVLRMEIAENKNSERRMAAFSILAVAGEYIEIDSAIERRAEEFEKSGIKAFDALHLATAEAGGARFLCSCDDKLLTKAKTIGDLKVTLILPIDLLREVKK